MHPTLQTPLIPLPENSQRSDNGGQDDLFATLFSPPTPRASPIPPSAPFDTNISRPPLPQRHSRTQSSDSEFGSFVSVPASEDPLHASGSAAEMTPFSPIQNIDFFDRFTEDTKHASDDRSKWDYLDELLEHQDDPLYFVQSSGIGGVSGTATPIPAQPALDVAPPVQEQQLLDLSPQASAADARQSRHLTRQQSRSEFGEARSRSPPLRSPSLPPSTQPRLSTPEIQRTQSSFFTPASLPSRWVSSLLSSAVRPSQHRDRAATDESKHEDRSAAHPSAVHSSTLPAAVPSQLLESASHFIQTPVLSSSQITSSISADAAITHGSPFASHPFIPATGAPGFAGDRQWNKGFEFDKNNVEKKSVRLVGRKEVTTPVLTVELADMLRPYFPALARLPRSWSLLYSLDQHGISLNTLYTRCQNHTGSALVVMRDSNDAIFGAWMGQGIHQSKGSYYGSGESFLWRLTADKGLRVYKWTGKNDYVALCEPEYLSFGGGDGHYGLYLDDSLIDGSSARCPTFENDPLCSAGPRQGDNVRFECVGLEVWGVG